ncbi:hypothetical protein RRG08_051180 [Elysia crispata]|uniref:Uncharacterized protein n=1 Tax=Elysia crispata TaxID=231223 RepID=A0AAE0Z6A1_9GAST|nr:hypothetical protein RRG08_051180 [Elysia crispata]
MKNKPSPCCEGQKSLFRIAHNRNGNKESSEKKKKKKKKEKREITLRNLQVINLSDVTSDSEGPVEIRIAHVSLRSMGDEAREERAQSRHEHEDNMAATVAWGFYELV